MDNPMKDAKALEPVETNEDLGSSAGEEQGSESTVESSPQVIQLSSKVITGAGLDMYQPGDVIYAPVKLKISASDDGTVNGITIEALGSATDSIPDDSNLIDLTSGAPVEDDGEVQEETATKGEPNPDAMGESGGENTEGENTTGDEAGSSAERYGHDGQDVDAETKMLGYKRPQSKRKKVSAKDLFGGK